MFGNRGVFISVEGIDGAGKSTHLNFIQDFLKHNGHEVILTREPGGTNLGEKIRELLLNSEEMDSNTELLLMFASRQELISKIILPNLKRGVCVIADRFIDASIAYQGEGRGLGVEQVLKVANLLVPRLETDLTFLFQVPIEVAASRLAKNDKKDRIEKESSEFFTRVDNAYRVLAANHPERIKTISTKNSKEETQKQIAVYLKHLLGSK